MSNYDPNVFELHQFPFDLQLHLIIIETVNNWTNLTAVLSNCIYILSWVSLYLYVAYVLDICWNCLPNNSPSPWLHPVFSSFVVVLVSFGRLQNLSLFDTKFDVSGMRQGQGEREEARADKMQIVRYTIGDGWGLESGWKWEEGSVIVYAITTFRFRGKVACLVASFVVHAASSGAYLQHFVALGYKQAVASQLWQPILVGKIQTSRNRILYPW